jgi:hypothetical protein
MDFFHFFSFSEKNEKKRKKISIKKNTFAAKLINYELKITNVTLNIKL